MKNLLGTIIGLLRQLVTSKAVESISKTSEDPTAPSPTSAVVTITVPMPTTEVSTSETKLNDLLKVFEPMIVRNALFPFTPIANIETNWPLIVESMVKRDMTDKDMLCYVLATMVVENDKFKPISEVASKYSDKDKQPPYDFSKYDTMPQLGNTEPGDGERFKGRGFIQITGRYNYTVYDRKLKLDGGLLEHPEAANEPHIAAAILVEYFDDRWGQIGPALLANDYAKLRKIVNGGTMHLDKFTGALKKARSIFL